MGNTALLSSFLLLAILVAEGRGEGYAPGDYRPDIGQGAPTDYGRPTAPNCHLEQTSTFEDRCLPYEETTCYSQNEEDCKEYYVNTCTPIVNTEVDRRCFNVTELICELVESVNYRQVEENFHVQSCYTTKDRICDTVHEIDTTTKDDLQCIELETPNCHMEDKILVDKVCTDTFEFECSPDKKLDNAGYGVKDTVCKKIPKHDCYDSPRTVQIEVCEPEYRRFCDKLTKDVPFPVERQNCHFERKKICQLVPKTKPKKAKVYSYTEDCKPVPREICDQCETKTLEAACVPEARMHCKYSPVTQCKKENKNYCYKAEVTKLVEICDKKLKTSYL
jgi:hypothetical protein